MTKDEKNNRVTVTRRSVNSARGISTKYRVVEEKNGMALLEIELLTGRTHQIRAQAACHGHPLAGDKKYGGSPFPGKRDNSHKESFYLHAWRLELPAETTISKTSVSADTPLPRLIEAPLPEKFRKKIMELFGKA